VAPARRRRPCTTAAPGFSPFSCASFLPPTPSPPFCFWWRRRIQGESPRRRRGTQGFWRTWVGDL
jgi:hypothetical protein